MGYGDQVLGSGFGRGAAARGKRVALGDGRRILWDQQSRHVFAHNPNVAAPGNEHCADIEWVAFYKGHRIYNSHLPGEVRWTWNYDFRPLRGQICHLKVERVAGSRMGKGFILIEPNVERWKSVAPNKDWGFGRYQAVADALRAGGHRVVQFQHGTPMLEGIEPVRTRSFRDALALMANAALYIGPEGGLHHGAAALETPAVVLFGGFIPPQVTGYDTHTNLTGGADEACGSLRPCGHCRAALDAISVEEVLAAAAAYLTEKAA